MIRKSAVSFLFIFISCLVLRADLPSWVKGGSSSRYPQEQFLTAVGKGATENEAVADSKQNIILEVSNILVSNGVEKAKINISPNTLMRSFETGYSHYDKTNNVYYVLGVVDKNMARINIEDDLYAAEQTLQYRTAVYETSNLPVMPKIKAVSELLELYERRDAVIVLKKALAGGSVVNTDVGEFEREKLIAERKKLFDNIVYYIKAENFNTAKLRKFLEENDFDVLSGLPSSPPEKDKGIAVINCKIHIGKAPNKTDIVDWIADFVLNDAFNEDTVLYSNTSAGEERGKDASEAGIKAAADAETEMNSMVQEFFKGII